jgi:hypothetical protein
MYTLPASSAEVRDTWYCISTLPHAFMAWYLIKHRNNFNISKDIPFLKGKEVTAIQSVIW